MRDAGAAPDTAKDAERPHLLVSAYAFSPVLGSEFAQGWNYVRQMRHVYRLTVLVGSSDGRMGDVAHLDHPFVAALGAGVRIVPVEMDRFCRVIKVLDVRYGLSWLFVLGLRRWHRLAFRRAAALHRENPFVAVHQLGPVGFRNPGYMHKLGVPSYWGPIGGFQYVDLKLAFRSSFRYGLTSLVRNVSTFLAARSGHVRTAVRGFDRLSFATLTNRRNFAALYDVDGPVLSDQAMVEEPSTEAVTAKDLTAGTRKSEPPPLGIVWCGSIDARKNIRLLLDIATRLQAMATPCAITVIGTGGMIEIAHAVVAERDLTNVHFTGLIPRDEVQEAFRQAHALCFTSLSEANTSTLFEALDAGCIPVAFDLDGFSTNISDDIGFRIDPRQDWNAIVGDYADRLDAIARDADLRARLTLAIRRDATRYSWASLAERHASIVASLPTPASGTAE